MRETELRFDSFFLYATEKTSGGDWECVDLILQSLSDEFQLSCRLIHYPDWPKSIPASDSIWDLIQSVQDWHLEYHNGPIVVVDEYGGISAATFCALHSLSCQLEEDSCVDVSS